MANVIRDGLSPYFTCKGLPKVHPSRQDGRLGQSAALAIPGRRIQHSSGHRDGCAIDAVSSLKMSEMVSSVGLASIAHGVPHRRMPTNQVNIDNEPAVLRANQIDKAGATPP